MLANTNVIDQATVSRALGTEPGRRLRELSLKEHELRYLHGMKAYNGGEGSCRRELAGISARPGTESRSRPRKSTAGLQENAMIDLPLTWSGASVRDGDAVIPGALKAGGTRPAAYHWEVAITNLPENPRQLRASPALGFVAEPDQLFTAVDAARQWLLARDLRPFCLVHENVVEEFADLAQHNPNAVLIADAAEGLSYRNLNRAFQLCVAGGCLYWGGQLYISVRRAVV